MPSSRALLALFALSLLGCPTTSSSAPDPTSTGEAASEGSTSVAVATTDTREPAEVPGPTLPKGDACERDADCDAEQVCEGMGCGAEQGRCTPRDRMCTRDLATYCGCDGKEFQNSGSCPGARYEYRGPCKPALGLGETCTSGAQCASGLCAGEGLEGCRGGSTGVCSDGSCTADDAVFCGCNGFDFHASSTCPNQQFAYRGPCEG
jgi:hypothetical protein